MPNWDLYESRINVSGYTDKDIQINSMKNSVLQSFDSSPSFEQVLIEGIMQDVNIVEESLIIKNTNRKLLLCKPDEIINIGNIVEFDNSNWICTENDTSSKIYDVGIISRTNNYLLFYDENSNLKEIPAIIGKGNINLSVDKFISLASDEYIITIPSSADGLSIVVGTRFILNGGAYIVRGTDPISTKGLIDIRVKEELIDSVDDNLILGIANYFSHQHTYLVDILNGSTALFRQNETLQLNVEVLDNSIVMSPTPTIVYSSSNVNICTVSATGFITGIAVGVCIITASYGVVSKNIAITVSAVIYDNITVDITGSTTVILNNSITLTSSILNNGIVDATKTVLWSISNQDLSSNVYLSVTSQTGNSIVLKATSNTSYVNKYAVIRATKSDDFSKFFDFMVQVKSLL